MGAGKGTGNTGREKGAGGWEGRAWLQEWGHRGGHGRGHPALSQRHGDTVHPSPPHCPTKISHRSGALDSHGHAGPQDSTPGAKGVVVWGGPSPSSPPGDARGPADGTASKSIPTLGSPAHTRNCPQTRWV